MRGRRQGPHDASCCTTARQPAGTSRRLETGTSRHLATYHQPAGDASADRSIDSVMIREELAYDAAWSVQLRFLCNLECLLAAAGNQGKMAMAEADLKSEHRDGGTWTIC